MKYTPFCLSLQFLITRLEYRARTVGLQWGGRAAPAGAGVLGNTPLQPPSSYVHMVVEFELGSMVYS